MPWLSIAVIVYGVMVAGGGIMGYVQAGSPMSAITGGLAGVLLIVAGVMSKNNPKAGYTMAAILAVALIAFFFYRYSTTHRAMPAFGVIGLSVLMLVLLVVGHFAKSASAPSVP
jgi:uncharacterized membrane protein (UPF0136 family)